MIPSYAAWELLRAWFPLGSWLVCTVGGHGVTCPNLRRVGGRSWLSEPERMRSASLFPRLRPALLAELCVLNHLSDSYTMTTDVAPPMPVLRSVHKPTAPGGELRSPPTPSTFHRNRYTEKIVLNKIVRNYKKYAFTHF